MLYAVEELSRNSLVIGLALIFSACGSKGGSRATGGSAPVPVNSTVPMYQAELNGQGQWILINGQYYFRPNVKLINSNLAWTPYQKWLLDVG